MTAKTIDIARLAALLGIAAALEGVGPATAHAQAVRLAPHEVSLRTTLRIRPVQPTPARPCAERFGAAARAGEIPGLLRNTVGFVVPMPGTEMIRVGVVQEGATLQAANRNPSLEGFRQEGVAQAKAATIHVIIRRPGS